MSTVHRKSRRRTEDRRPLYEAWQAGEPPPSWAYEPGEHHEEITDLYFFKDRPDQRDWRTHPHLNDWAAAMESSARGKEVTP